MATVVLNFVKTLWPFRPFIADDLRTSDRLVKKLAIPETTKRFVYAIEEPTSGAVVYVLCVQNLSERSARDAECLIREVKPEAVVSQVGATDAVNETSMDEMGCKDCNSGGNECSCGRSGRYLLPTSSFQVLKNCFVHKINREKYENVAGNLVLKEVFGVDFNGHLLSAKKAAEEIGASFLCLESPFVRCGGDEGCASGNEEVGNRFRSLGLQLSCSPQRVSSKGTSNVVGSFGLDSIQAQMVKSMSSYLIDSGTIGKGESEPTSPSIDYVAPQFAQSIYPLFVDLHSIFNYIPSMGRGLSHAQKMFCDINKGEVVDTQLLSEVYVFRIAVEGLRIALNNAGRLANVNSTKSSYSEAEFSKLPTEEKSHALVAEALRTQTKRFKSIVAIVDARGLLGLRKHWNTAVPEEIKDIVEQLVSDCVAEETTKDRNRLLAEKPVVAIGAGATAVLGASSLSKVIPVSTYAKFLSLKLPASFKLAIAQTQRIGFLLGKTGGPSKIVSPGMASGFQPSTLNAAASAEKIRTIVHSVIASAERTSFSAMRTAFYEIMRSRRVRPVGILPLATFTGSIATCAGLLMYGDGIECVAESFPSAPSIASLGRGIRSLHEASEAVRSSESSRIQKSIESLMHRFRKMKLQ